jgi:hypothetical protein
LSPRRERPSGRPARRNPTGGGRSAIYELAALLRGGPTLVVSPLIALQDDQLAHLRAADLPATVLNSAQSAGARVAALVEACGPDEFVFVSPEQLSNDETRDALRRARPELFVVDEAHLVSQWGQDFRPDYLRLGAQADELGAGVRIALTATAAPPVRREIRRRLRLRDPEEVIGDFDRPHIELSVQHPRLPEDKQRLIAQAAGELGGAGIVYAATHAGAEAARDALVAAGERATLYHAGLGAAARRRAMAEFLDGPARRPRPDPYDTRPGPRDPAADSEGMDFGDVYNATGATRTSEPPHEADLEVGPAQGEPARAQAPRTAPRGRLSVPTSASVSAPASITDATAEPTVSSGS